MSNRVYWSEIAVWLVAIASLVALLVERQLTNSLRKDLIALHTGAAIDASSLKRRVKSYEGLIGHIAFTEEITLRGIGRDGDSSFFNPRQEAGRTLLYSIVPNCASCWDAIPFLNTLNASEACDVRVLAIVVGDAATFNRADEGRTGFDVLLGASGQLWYALPLDIPSSAALIGQHGRLEGLWPGSPAGLPTGEILGRLEPKCAVK